MVELKFGETLSYEDLHGIPKRKKKRQLEFAESSQAQLTKGTAVPGLDLSAMS